jgi:RNA polymerase sigma-70 factor (ECF subfamily)
MEQRFIAAVREHRTAMFRLARSMLRKDWDAEDAVSEAMEKAWHRIHSLRDWNSARPWLLRITYRCCLEIQKKRNQELPLEDASLQLMAGGYTDETPLWIYLEALPEKGRVVMHLRYAEGLPIQEIAKVLRLPRGTVSARISRATKQLRNMIEKEEQRHE